MRSIYWDEGLASVCLLWTDSAECSQKPLRNSTSMFLGAHLRTSWSSRVPARIQGRHSQAERNVRPFSDRAHVPTDNLSYWLQCSAGPQSTGASAKLGLVNSCEPVLSHGALPDFWYKAGTTLSFPWNNWHPKYQSAKDTRTGPKQWKQLSGTVAESCWIAMVQHRRISKFLRVSKLQRQWNTRWREVWFGKLCCCHSATSPQDASSTYLPLEYINLYKFLKKYVARVNSYTKKRTDQTQLSQIFLIMPWLDVHYIQRTTLYWKLMIFYVMSATVCYFTVDKPMHLRWH